jgi:DNA-binding winged helix-turn-helix (wHTH) protein
MEQSDGAGSTIRFGVFEVDPRSGELRKAGTRIRLQEQPFEVLLALLEHSGEVVSRNTLRRRIWPTESFGDFDHAVNVAVAKLRTALGDSADTPRYVETLHRRGYRFVFPVAPSRRQGIASPVESNLKSRSEQRSEPETIAVAGHAGSSDNRRARIWGFLTVIAILAVATGTFWYYRPAPKLSDSDTIVLADFTNTTGDPVFDGTLR